MKAHSEKQEVKLDPLYAENQIGRFKVTRRFLEQNMSRLSFIFSRIFPVEIVSVWQRNCVDYVAYSELFRPVAEGNMIPEYMLTCRTDKRGNIELLEAQEVETRNAAPAVLNKVQGSKEPEGGA